VFDRACNLVNSKGEVLSLISGERGMTPFALLLPTARPPLFTMLSEDSMVRLEAKRLHVGPLTIAWEAAGSWNPRPNWAALRYLFAETGNLEALAAQGSTLPMRGSLLELFNDMPRESTLTKPVRERIWTGAKALVEGLCNRSESLALEGALTLAGVGGGLTPAGDDFVTGALLAVWSGMCGPGLEGLAASVADAAAGRTTTLSRAYLRAAGRGECSAPWQALFAALLADEPAGRQRALEALLAVGHTSGGDGLAGFLASHFIGARLTSNPQVM
jgi:hypothetical protein